MEKSEYTCSICQDIFCCPMTTPCCLQTFCEDCITGWLQNNTTCPYDRKGLCLDKLTGSPRVLANMLGTMNIKCDFWDNGCREVVKLEDLIQHTAICEHNEANRPKTCDLTLAPRAMCNHDHILLLDPNSELHFRSAFSFAITSYLKLRNPWERRACFRVMTTVPKRYWVRPNHGLIESFGTVTIAVRLRPVDIDNASDKNSHEFMVQTMFAPEGAVNQETLWKVVNPEAIITSKLKCVFDVTPPSNETPVR
ncbi:unnamed protein product [Oppiella nova]|uniref:RING-type domain-containing protein n=1 Tax=Oppiella nova TaxID=334625 RepID=A0A7R9QHM0_9ACAR|nr:unnamed protein product [Oppiella nova]CAG2165546.1 unnamed protein product [Oppiella nova]